MRPTGQPRLALLVASLLAVFALLCSATGALRADTLKADAELTTKEIGMKESVLANAIADAIKASAKTDAAFVAADYFNEINVPNGASWFLI